MIFFKRKDLLKYSKNAKFHGDRIILERTARGNVSKPPKISLIGFFTIRSSYTPNIRAYTAVYGLYTSVYIHFWNVHIPKTEILADLTL